MSLRPLAALAIVLAALLAPTPAHARLDPLLRWRTFETAHFRIHFAAGLEPVAEHVARVAERAHRRLVPAMGWDPSEVTQIVLLDDTDSANGFAFTIPYNAITLYVTSPPDLSTLSDYEDWYVELVVHEYAHVLHLDRIGGLPALINAIFGKVMAPNQVQPRFVIEGIATYEESARTSAGRGRASYFDMLLRMDVLEGRFAPIDQVTNDARRWPYANIRYLYGSRFFGYVADRFGEDAIDRISHEYGRNLIAYDLNRVMRRATGHDYVELWEDWHASLRDHYGAQARELRARGIRGGRRITDHGEDVQYPRFTRDGRRVVYYVADGVSHAAFRSVSASEEEPGGEPAQIVWASTEARPSFTPDGDVVFHRASTHRQVYYWNDLYRFEPRTGRTRRLTRGLRASSPDVSPDGERLTFTVNHAGTTELVVSDAGARGRRVLVRGDRFEQVYTPRWSPDGRRIAYSAWTAGGYRDLCIVDVATRRVERLMHDRALDMTPVWSPDGRTIYWTSDRSGIANVHAMDLATREIHQVTNVLGGAYQPDVSPDGRTLVFAEYRAHGFDLVRMPIDPSQFLPSLPAPPRPPTEVPLDRADRPIVRRHRYDASDTLRPRFFLLEETLDAYGDAIAITTQARDVVGLHQLDLEVDVGRTEPNLGVQAAYVYGGTRPDVGVTFARSVRPASWQIDSEPVPYTEQVVFGSLSSFWGLSEPFRDQAISLSYTLSHYSVLDPPRLDFEPSDHPQRPPDLGRVATLRFGWIYSNAFRPTWGISAESGRFVSLAVRTATPEIGSEYESIAWDWDWAEYLGIPFLPRHALALRVAGGIAQSEFRGRGTFSLPTLPFDQDVIQALRLEQPAPSAVLRGYLPGAMSGNQFHLWNLEYRFPILRIERGLLTFPVFLGAVHGAVFFDSGAAFFDRFDLTEFRHGTGGELLIDTTLAYVLPATFKLGWAKGLSEGGIADFYFVFGGSF